MTVYQIRSDDYDKVNSILMEARTLMKQRSIALAIRKLMEVNDILLNAKKVGK